MRKILLTAFVLGLVACASSTAPTDPPKPSLDQAGGTPPHCNPGYHESQSSGGAAPTCVPNG